MIKENIILLTLCYFIIKIFYKCKYNKHYECSNLVHFFGLLYPISIIFLLNYYNNSINYLTYIVCLILSYSMFYYHLLYHFDKNK